MKLSNIAFLVTLLTLMAGIASMALTAEPKPNRNRGANCALGDVTMTAKACVTFINRQYAALR